MNRRGRPPYPDVLTPRQWQVLALLREGLSNEQIALRLGISVDGVKFHVSEILGKLGVGSRNEAAHWEGEQRQAAPSACLAGVRWRRRPPLPGLSQRRLFDRPTLSHRGRGWTTRCARRLMPAAPQSTTTC